MVRPHDAHPTSHTLEAAQSVALGFAGLLVVLCRRAVRLQRLRPWRSLPQSADDVSLATAFTFRWILVRPRSFAFVDILATRRSCRDVWRSLVRVGRRVSDCQCERILDHRQMERSAVLVRELWPNQPRQPTPVTISALTNGVSGGAELRTQLLATKLSSCSYILVRAGNQPKSELRLKRGKLSPFLPQNQISRNVSC